MMGFGSLKEIIDADHILLLVDISEDMDTIREKLGTCLKTIDQLITESFTIPRKKAYADTSTDKQVLFKRPELHLVFNKSDLEQDIDRKSKAILMMLLSCL